MCNDMFRLELHTLVFVPNLVSTLRMLLSSYRFELRNPVDKFFPHIPFLDERQPMRAQLLDIDDDDAYADAADAAADDAADAADAATDDEALNVRNKRAPSSSLKGVVEDDIFHFRFVPSTKSISYKFMKSGSWYNLTTHHADIMLDLIMKMNAKRQQPALPSFMQLQPGKTLRNIFLMSEILVPPPNSFLSHHRNEANGRSRTVDPIVGAIDNILSVRNPSIQVDVNAYFDALMKSITGKEGLIRGNLLKKPVNSSARMVITPDPNLPLDTVMIPRPMAVAMHVRKRVTPENKQSILDSLNGNKVMSYDPLRNERHSINVRGIRIGLILEVPITNGDYVIFTRNPAIHKFCMIAMKVRVGLDDALTFRMNPVIAPAFNADFDGDVMNIFATDPDSIHDNMKLQNNILSTNLGQPIFGVFQDAVMGLYYLTQSHRHLTRRVAMQLCSAINVLDIDLNPPGGGPLHGTHIIGNLFPDTFEFVSLDDKVHLRGRNLRCLRPLMAKDVGAVKDGIIQKFARTYDPDATLRLIDRLQRLGVAYLDMYGHSMDLTDASSKDNSTLRDMVTCGSKGKTNNIVQLQEHIGEQSIQGRPLVHHYRHGRVTTHVDMGMDSSVVTSNFVRGMTIVDAYKHYCASRESLTQNATSTTVAGTILRNLAMVLQDVVVAEDGRLVVPGQTIMTRQSEPLILDRIGDQIGRPVGILTAHALGQQIIQISLDQHRVAGQKSASAVVDTTEHASKTINCHTPKYPTFYFGTHSKDVSCASLKEQLMPKYNINSTENIKSQKNKTSVVKLTMGIPGLVEIREGEEKGKFLAIFRRMSIDALVSAGQRLMMHPDVDPTSVFPNDVRVCHVLFGVDAARNVIIRELSDVFKEVGLVHLFCLANCITTYGAPCSIMKLKLLDPDRNVLHYAASRESWKVFLKAGLMQQKDEVTSVNSMLMTNRHKIAAWSGGHRGNLQIEQFKVDNKSVLCELMAFIIEEEVRNDTIHKCIEFLNGMP